MRVHHIALRVSDCLRSAAFYPGVLGLSEVRRAVDGGEIRAVWLRRLKAAGLPVVDRTPHTLYVSDPDGHRVGLTIFGTVAH